MRILMFSWEYPPHVVGGLGKHVAEIVPALGKAVVPFGPSVTPLFLKPLRIRLSLREPTK